MPDPDEEHRSASSSNTVERRKVQFLTPTSEKSQPQFPVPQPRLQKPPTSDAEDEERVEIRQPQMAQTFSVGTIKSGDF
jgi:hypothetical protein